MKRRAAWLAWLLFAGLGDLRAQEDPLPLDPEQPLSDLVWHHDPNVGLRIVMHIEAWERTIASRRTAQRQEATFVWECTSDPPSNDGRFHEHWQLATLRFDVPDERGRRVRFDSANLDHYERPDDAWLAELDRMRASPIDIERTERGRCVSISGLDAFLGNGAGLNGLGPPLERWLRLACFECPPRGSLVSVRWSSPLEVDVTTPEGWLVISGLETLRVRRVFRTVVELEGTLAPDGETPRSGGLALRSIRRRARFDRTRGCVPFQRLEVEFGDGRVERRQVVEVTIEDPRPTERTPRRSRFERARDARRRGEVVHALPHEIHAAIGRALFRPWE